MIFADASRGATEGWRLHWGACT